MDWWRVAALLLLLHSRHVDTSKRKHSGRTIRMRRNPSAFALARLQHNYDQEDASEDAEERGQIVKTDGQRRRDDVLNDAKCLARCNRELTIGMDMVDAHTSFGSIDVPSVVSAPDLDLFCSLDSAHSQCIDDCGYSVQFNLREYVCNRRRNEMVEFIPCYKATAPYLSRYCRPRCGKYHPLEHSQSGYGARCRQLLCDHTCADFLLRRVCGAEEGKRASEFLLHFSRIQVDFWVSEFARQRGKNPRAIYPRSCLRLHCNDFNDRNCTEGRR